MTNTTKANTANTDFEDEQISQDASTEDGELLDFEAFTTGDSNFIKNPAVGKSVEFTVDKIVKMKEKSINQPGRKPFKVALSSVDYYYDLVTPNGMRYSVVYWKIVGKIKAIARKLGTVKGLDLKIEHSGDGFADKTVTDPYKVYVKVEGEYKQLDKATNAWV